MDDLPGRNLGPYHIVEEFGEGSMASVYKGYQPNMDRHVAIKVLPSVLARDPQFADRFEQEAKVIAGLEHARILPVYDYGSENGVSYLVMRLLDGGTLRERIDREGALDLEEIARIIGQVAEGLDYAHGKNVVHRDVTPNNIMFDEAGDAYVTDFGIAKIMAGTAHITGTDIVGTPAFISPEQGSGERIDHRSDIYGLGIVLYLMAVGDVPFHADSPLAMVVKHINEPFPDPTLANPDLPVAVANVILKATAKNPDERFQSCGALADALDAAVSGTMVGQATEKLVYPPSASASAKRARAGDPSAGRGRMPAWALPVAIGGGLLGIGLLVAVIVLLVRGPSPGVESAQAETPVSVTEEAPEPTQTVPPPAAAGQGVLPSTAGVPGVAPPGSGSAGGIGLLDASLDLCAEGWSPVLSHDFDEARPEGITAVVPEAFDFVSLEGDWLVVSPMQLGMDIGLGAGPSIPNPQIVAKVLWQNAGGPASLALGTHTGTGPDALGYSFIVANDELFRLTRESTTLAETSDVPSLFDGETHTVEFVVEGGTLRGSVDGQVVVEAEDPDPLPSGAVTLHAGIAPVYVDVLGVCSKDSVP